MREARAFALSIYLMGGMPYLLLSAFGIYAYRAVRKQNHFDQAGNNAETSDP